MLASMRPGDRSFDTSVGSGRDVDGGAPWAPFSNVPIDRRSPVVPQVHRILREGIVSIQLRPGQVLSEKDVADQLGVSRTPVREAFIRLATEGLVDIFPQLGTVVARIDVDAVIEAQFVREVLEVAAARDACAASDESLMAPLFVNLRGQAEACDTGDLDRFHELDEALHRTIFGIGGHSLAWRVIHTAKPHLDRVRRLSLPNPAERQLDITQHGEIVEAIVAANAQATEEAVRKHARSILGALPHLRARLPQYFTESQATTATGRPGVPIR